MGHYGLTRVKKVCALIASMVYRILKKPYELLLKIYQIIVKTRYASSHVSIDSKLFKGL